MKKCNGCDTILVRNQTKWCSETCAKNHYKRPSKTGKCQECNKVFEYPRCEDNRKFCSRHCLGKDNARRNNAPRIAKRIQLTCKQCNKTYERPPAYAKKSKFCSRTCQTAFSAPVDLTCHHCKNKYTRIPAEANRS